MSVTALPLRSPQACCECDGPPAVSSPGTRAQIRDYEDCNVGEVRTNALVTRGGDNMNETEINTILNLFLHAQQHFGQKFGDEFR